jgi:hypothetical protein
MTAIKPTIRRMTYEEAQQFRLFNRGLTMEYRGTTYNLTAGLSDQIHIFTRSICIFVLTVNKSLGYIGLDAYEPNEVDPVNSIFLHSDYQLQDILGPKWDQLSPKSITNTLVDYLI